MLNRVGVWALLLVAVVATATGSAATPVGAWRRLPAAPLVQSGPTASVWTGREMIVFVRAELVQPQARGGAYGSRSIDTAAAYSPAQDRWRVLSPPSHATAGAPLGSYHAVWTGAEMILWGPQGLEAYVPASDRWLGLASSPLHHVPGIVVWTGHELIGWGGGCCGEAFADGAAYDPLRNQWHMLPPAPVGGRQRPVGAWTGTELVIVDGEGADGNSVGGAAYDPRTERWHRIASLPAKRLGAAATWDGHELLVSGGGAPRAGGMPVPAAVAFAYDPLRNRWRTLRAMDGGRYGRWAHAAVWTGDRLLVWGGETAYAGDLVLATHGLAYDPGADRWTQLPPAPLLDRADPEAVWTGKAMIVWGGQALQTALPGTTGAPDYWPLDDGAMFTP